MRTISAIICDILEVLVIANLFRYGGQRIISHSCTSAYHYREVHKERFQGQWRFGKFTAVGAIVGKTVLMYVLLTEGSCSHLQIESYYRIVGKSKKNWPLPSAEVASDK